jgi:predicted O-linked N-acetylglucosamine transferase (SPINDLY family)
VADVVRLMTRVTIEQAIEIASAHQRAGRLAEAEGVCREVLAQVPDQADALRVLGITLHAAGRRAEAIAALGRVAEILPGSALAHNNLGVALRVSGRLEEAIVAYGRALELEPTYAPALNNLGNALRDAGRLEEAAAALGRAVALDPASAAAHNNLGVALHEIGRLDEAIAAFGQAIHLRPDSAMAHDNLGNSLAATGQIDEAIAAHRRAIALDGDLAVAYDNLLFHLHHHPGYDARALLAEHRLWAGRLAAPLAAAIQPHGNDRRPNRKLRIGFVSPDFRDHPVGRQVLALFRHHDSAEAEFVGYSDVRRADEVTRGLEASCSCWRNIVGRDDADVAEQIRADGIDILVDLALHTAGNRLLVFARKPAPVQVTMLGLPSTSGLATIDYRLTDAYLDPPGATDAEYSERSIFLPGCFWVFPPPDDATALPVAALPASSNGYVTFGCLNQFAKVSRPAMELWVEILRAVPGSRLVLQSPPGRHLEGVREVFAQGGIPGGQLEFTMGAARAEHLRRFDRLDLALDPFPYNGHTSTLDALWMGVPVVTLAGGTAVGRGGVSILSNVGLPELIGSTPSEYVEIATRWATDMDRLARLRAELRSRLEASPLGDAQQYAADVDAAFRRIWQTWCQDQK